MGKCSRERRGAALTLAPTLCSHSLSQRDWEFEASCFPLSLRFSRSWNGSLSLSSVTSDFVKTITHLHNTPSSLLQPKPCLSFSFTQQPSEFNSKGFKRFHPTGWNTTAPQRPRSLIQGSGVEGGSRSGHCGNQVYSINSTTDTKTAGKIKWVKQGWRQKMLLGSLAALQ